VVIGVSPHAPYSVSDALYAGVAAYARREALPVAVHIAESAAETQLVTEGAGPFADFLRARGIGVARRAESPVALLERTQVLSVKPLCIHAVLVTDADVARIAAAGATIAHCPRANAWFGKEEAPVRAFRDAGVGVGLGTDSVANNDTVRVLEDARDAADSTLSAAERIGLVTAGGARALALDDTVGTLEAGKRADLAAFAVADVAECDRDPARFLLDHCATQPSLITVVDGVVRAKRGRAVAYDAALDARMTAHRARVRAWRENLPQ
jgi:cytosine/adenosine deaminase-related metal-dependent hydrolase